MRLLKEKIRVVGVGLVYQACILPRQQACAEMSYRVLVQVEINLPEGDGDISLGDTYGKIERTFI